MTDKAAQVAAHVVRPAEVADTSLDRLGIEGHMFLPASGGRPIQVLDEGEPIGDLFV